MTDKQIIIKTYFRQEKGSLSIKTTNWMWCSSPDEAEVSCVNKDIREKWKCPAHTHTHTHTHTHACTQSLSFKDSGTMPQKHCSSSWLLYVPLATKSTWSMT
jgi:hypothetical protein